MDRFGDTNKIEENIYDEMDNVFLRDLLPNDLEFDMNMHTLKFMPDGCHPYVETHVQEHGAYLLGGQGLYLLGEEWLSVQRKILSGLARSRSKLLIPPDVNRYGTSTAKI